jgi:hypothetical protein
MNIGNSNGIGNFSGVGGSGAMGRGKNIPGQSTTGSKSPTKKPATNGGNTLGIGLQIKPTALDGSK